MKRIAALVLLASFSAALAATEDQYYAYLASCGVDPDSALSSGAVALVDYGDLGVLPAFWTVQVPLPDVAALPSDEESRENLRVWRETRKAAKEIARQAAKSARLKGAEKQLVKFLRDEGAIAADAVSATPEQIDAMYADWEATLNDTQLEKKSTKYTRLLEKVERAGGTEADAFYHE